MYLQDADFYDEEDRKKAQIVTQCEGNERNKRLLRQALAEANTLSQEVLRGALAEIDEIYGKRLNSKQKKESLKKSSKMKEKMVVTPP